MDAWCFSFLRFVLLSVLVQSQQNCQAASNIAVDTVSVTNENDTVILTVTYIATAQPVNISWIFPYLPSGGGMANIDFQQEDIFGNGAGRTVARVKHDIARTQPSRIATRMLILSNVDCQVTLEFPTFDDLISRSATTQNVATGLTLQKNGVALEPGQEMAFGPWDYTMDISAVLSSPELSKFKLDKPSVSHVRFVYQRGVPERRRTYSTSYFTNANGVRIDDGFSGGETEKRLGIHFSRHTYQTGIVRLYDVELEWNGGSETLVTKVTFAQNLYVLKQPGDLVMERNSVYLKTTHSHFFNNHDIPINFQVPQVSFAVYGNPQPHVTLYRACADVVPAEVEVTEVREESQYFVIRFFTFKNVTEALQGSYIAVVRSGEMETREIVSIGLV